MFGSSNLFENYGYNYLALEQGTVVCRMFSSQHLVGNREAVADFSLKYTVDAILIIGNSRPGTYTLTRDRIRE